MTTKEHAHVRRAAGFAFRAVVAWCAIALLVRFFVPTETLDTASSAAVGASVIAAAVVIAALSGRSRRGEYRS